MDNGQSGKKSWCLNPGGEKDFPEAGIPPSTDIIEE
jgi:hypothetical protein